VVLDVHQVKEEYAELMTASFSRVLRFTCGKSHLYQDAEGVGRFSSRIARSIASSARTGLFPMEKLGVRFPSKGLQRFALSFNGKAL